MTDKNDPKKSGRSQTYTGRRSVKDKSAENEISIVGQRIRLYREKKGMEQKALAEKIGVIANAVSNWENGRSRPDLALLPKICTVLNVTLDELFGMPSSAAEPKPAITMKKAGDELLLTKYRRLNKGHRSVVDSMLDKLAEAEDYEVYERIIGTTEFTKQLAAGFDPGCEFDDEGETILLYKDMVNSLTDCIFTVSGDSMEPDFHSGDKVMVQRLTDGSGLEFGEIGAFIFGNETYIKEYRKNGLHSLNPKYKLMRFNNEDSVYIIGRVLGVLSPEAIVSFEDALRYERAKERIEEKLR